MIWAASNCPQSSAEPIQEGRHIFRCPPRGAKLALRANTRTAQLQVESALVPGRQHPSDQPRERDCAVSGDGPLGDGPVSVDIIAELHDAALWNGLSDQRPQIRLRPAGIK